MLREKFHWNYIPSDDYFDNLWKNAVFVFDTNILINFYKYNNKSTKAILKLLISIKDRIWLPYQVGLEFSKGLKSALNSEILLSKNIISEVEKISNKLKNSYGYDLNWDTFMESEKKKIKHYEKLKKKDTLIDDIEKIIGLGIADKMDVDTLEKIYKDGKERFNKKIPPGFGDKKDKPEPQRYGDLVIWKELLAYAKKHKKDIIFITEDHTKEDWFEKEDEKTIGPHRDLREEFGVETNNQLFWIYRSKMFFSQLEKYLDKTMNDNVKEDITHVGNRSMSESKRSSTFDTYLKEMEELGKLDTPYKKLSSLSDSLSELSMSEKYLKALNDTPYKKLSSLSDSLSGLSMSEKYLKALDDTPYKKLSSLSDSLSALSVLEKWNELNSFLKLTDIDKLKGMNKNSKKNDSSDVEENDEDNGESNESED